MATEATSSEDLLLGDKAIIDSSLSPEQAGADQKVDNLSSKQLLPDYIFCYITNHFVDSCRDVLHLALSSKALWKYLEGEIYVAEIKAAKEAAVMLVRGTPDAYAAINTHASEIEDASERLRLFRLRPNFTRYRPALHQAINDGNSEVARKLVDASIDHWPNYVEVKHKFVTPLLLAQIRRRADTVEYLVRGGSFVDAWNDEVKGTVRSRRQGHDFVKDLELKRSCFKKMSKVLWSPLGYAIAMRHSAQALLLAENTCDQGLKPIESTKNESYMPPLHLAAFAGMHKVVKTLLERGYEGTTRSYLFCDATPFDMAAAGVDNNQLVMQILINSIDTEAKLPDPASAWTKALINRAPNNAITLLETWHLKKELLNLTKEVKFCLETDELLPVLQWVVEHDKSPTIRQDVERMCHKLIAEKKGIESGTMRYLRNEGMVERSKTKIKLINHDKAA